MTSSNRRPLEAVIDQDGPRSRETDLPVGNVGRLRDRDAEKVINQWAPEHQLIGALMHLPASEAKPMLDAVPDTAIWLPIARWAYELIRALVDAGRKPDPALVLRRGSVQSASDALHPNRPPRRAVGTNWPSISRTLIHKSSILTMPEATPAKSLTTLTVATSTTTASV